MSLAAAPTLPPQPTALIGREDVLAQAAALMLGGTRLLTLFGPGGVGKTRLAVALAEQLAPHAQGGVAFVDLTGEQSPQALPGRIAQVFGLTLSGQGELASLAAQLQGQPRLLLLDNFESVPAAAPLLGELLAACPALSVLVTSRVALNLRWEHRLPLDPLALPAAGDAEHAALSADASPAVQLYLERARAAGGPELSDLDAAARLCARLDGLPLAIELAAARAAQFGPQALLDRLERHLALPHSQAPDRPARHHSLNAAIGASYHLLSGPHQAVLRHLAVATGGLSEGAARAVAIADQLTPDGLRPDEPNSDEPNSDWPNSDGPNAEQRQTDTLDALLALTDVSLLYTRHGPGGEPRFFMLETIRAYALEQADPAETLLARQRHAHWCLELAERLTPRWRSQEQAQVLAHLQGEHLNFQAALGWALASGAAADRRLGERLAEALWPFWLARGHAAEGRAWLDAALGVDPQQEQTSEQTAEQSSVQSGMPPSVGLLRGAGVLARQGGDLRRAARWAEQAIAVARSLADAQQEAAATGDLGVALAYQGDLDRAGDAFEAQLNLYTVLGDDHGVTEALNNSGTLAVRCGDWALATELLTQALTLRQHLGDLRGEAIARNNLGILAFQQNDWAQAAAHLTRALELRRELGDVRGEAESLSNLGTARWLAGDAEGAADLFRRALTLHQELAEPLGVATAQLNLGTALLDLMPDQNEAGQDETGQSVPGQNGAGQLSEPDEVADLLLAAAGTTDTNLPVILRAEVVQALARLAGIRHQWTLAARLAGAADVIWEQVPDIQPVQQRERDALRSATSTHLTELQLGEALSAGRLMSWDDILASSARRMAAPPADSGAAPGDTAGPADRDALSEREREVLALLINGWPNKKIAASMKLSGNTVKNHLASVYSKLGVRGRAEAVARALQERLLE